MAPNARIELASDPYQGPVLPLNYIGMVPIKGFEPSTYSLRESCSTPELNRHQLYFIIYNKKTGLFFLPCFDIVLRDKITI